MTRNVSKQTDVLFYSVLILGAILVLIPFWWAISTSFDKLNSNSMPFPPRIFPKTWTLYNYKVAISNVEIIRYTANTFVIIIFSFVFNVILAAISGFALSKGRFPFRNILLVFFLTSMMVPFECRIIEVYNIIHWMNINDTYIGLLLPSFMTNAFYIFLMKKAFDDIPDSFMDSAQIDGASRFRILRQIYLPIVVPVVATIGVLDAVSNWNDLLWPMMILKSSSLFTVQIALIRYVTKHPGVICAVTMLSIVPIGIVFILAQKWIIQGVASSGVKA